MTKARLSLIAAFVGIIAAGAAHAQFAGTLQPYGTSIYGGPPQGYTFQMQNAAPIYRPPMPTPAMPPQTMCYTSHTLAGAITRCN